MNTKGESPNPPEASTGRAAEGNCVAVRPGGEQPEADLRSQTKVNPIRPGRVASLLGTGEACLNEDDRIDPDPSQRGQVRALLGGWGENVGKCSGGRVENCARRMPETGQRAVVRAAIVAKKRGNARGAKGGRKVEGHQAMNREDKSASVPAKDKQAEENLWHRHKAERGVWTEAMLVALERGVKGNKWFSLIDKIAHDRTLGLAWAKVKSNAGSCGVDGITVGRFEKDSLNRLLVVKEHLKQNTYQPKPVNRVWIPKPGSTQKRPLGIPTVSDRVVQTALRMVIEPIFESRFYAQSYGFRPGRGCKDALRRVDELLRKGYVHVVDVDIKGYFDSIDHHRLMERVGDRIADGRVLSLIEAFLKQGVMEGTDWVAAKEGTPQGGVISPLLANVYLNALDWQMADAGFEMIRYADDMVVMCRDAQSGQEALERLSVWMADAKLTLHPEKTGLVDMSRPRSHFDFLGYRFLCTGKGKLIRLVRPKSLQKLRESIKPRTRRTSGRCMPALVADVNKTLIGWFGYFRQAHPSVLREVDQWMRSRLRAILRRRRHLRGRARGLDHHRWPNRYFTRLGLFCLLDARAAVITGLRHGANH